MNNKKYRNRLHWSAVLISFFSSLKHLMVPIIFGVIFGTTSSTSIFGTFYFYIIVVILVFSFLHSFLYWLTFRYEWVDGELRIVEGVFVKKRRYIRVERVQSVDLSSGVIQRMFGLVSVKIETAGGGNEPEIHLIAIKQEEGIRTRNFLLQKDHVDHTDEAETIETIEDKRDYWILTRRDLVIASLTSSGIGIVLTAVIALFPQIEQIFSITLFEQFVDFFLGTSYLLVLLYSLFILAVAWLISILITIFKYGNFSVEKVGNELTITRGLLERRQLTLQIDRVTAVRIVRNIFRQPFGYSAVYVESKGGGTNEEQRSTVVFPLVKHRLINDNLTRFLPEYQISNDVISAPRRSLLRFQIRILFVPILIWLILLYFNATMLYLFGVLVLLSMLGFWQFRDAAVAIDQQQVMLTYRLLSKHLVIIRKNKVQSGELVSSPIQRKRSLTNVRLSVLSSLFGKTFSVRDVDEATGLVLLHWLSQRRNKE